MSTAASTGASGCRRLSLREESPVGGYFSILKKRAGVLFFLEKRTSKLVDVTAAALGAWEAVGDYPPVKDDGFQVFSPGES
jgi:hypothetical protein